MDGNLAFHLRGMGERFVPAFFQLCCYKAVRRVGSIVLAEGTIHRVARGFKIALERFAYLIPPQLRFLLGGDGGRNGAGTHNSEKRSLDRVIDAQASKRDTTRLAIVHPTPATAVAWDTVLHASIPKRQFASA